MKQKLLSLLLLTAMTVTFTLGPSAWAGPPEEEPPPVEALGSESFSEPTAEEAAAAAYEALGGMAESADDSGEVVIFEQDFDTHNAAPADLDGSVNTYYQVLSHADNNHAEMAGQGNYGSFYYANWHKVGWNFDSRYQNVKHGKVHIVFDFSSSQPTSAYKDSNATGVVGLGQTAQNKQTLSLINIMGTKNGGTVADGDPEDQVKREIYTLGLWSYGSVPKINPAYSVTKDKWYRYDGTIDIETREYSFTVTPLDEAEKAEKGTASYSTESVLMGTAAAGQARWANWPSDGLALNAISITEMLDIDNIKVSYAAAPLVIKKIAYVDTNGEEQEKASVKTTAVRLEFGSPVDASTLDGKFTLDGRSISGTLLSDQMTYEIPIADAWNYGETHALDVAAGVLAEDPSILPGEAHSFTIKVGDYRTVFEEDFEASSTAPFVDLGNANFQYEVAQEDGNRFARVLGIGGKGGYNFQAVTSGKLMLRFRFMYDHVSRLIEPPIYNSAVVCLGHVYGSEEQYKKDPLSVLVRMNDEVFYAAGTQADTTRRIGRVSAKRWYNYEALLDLDEHTIKLKVETDEGEKNIYAEIPLRSVPEGDSGANYMYKDWPIVTNIDSLSFWRSTNIDDIRISRYYEKPEVKKITVRAVDGTEQLDLSAVDPASGSLSIDFGERMDQTTLTPDSVRLINTQNGSEVSYTGALDEATGRVYTLSFSGLAPETTYRLYVSGDAANVDGGLLYNDFETELTTREGRFAASLSELTAGGNPVESFEQLSGKASVRAAVSNIGDKDIEAAVYLIYSDESGRPLSIEVRSFEVKAHSSAANVSEFDINKPEGAVSAKLFLWSGGAPLAEPIYIK